jgi:hypothetical protein
MRHALGVAEAIAEGHGPGTPEGVVGRDSGHYHRNLLESIGYDDSRTAM